MLPGWLREKESTCQCRRHRLNPWSSKVPCAVEQPSPCATTTKTVLWSRAATTTDACTPQSQTSTTGVSTAMSKPHTTAREKPRQQRRPSTAKNKSAKMRLPHLSDFLFVSLLALQDCVKDSEITWSPKESWHSWNRSSILLWKSKCLKTLYDPMDYSPARLLCPWDSIKPLILELSSWKKYPGTHRLIFHPIQSL